LGRKYAEPGETAKFAIDFSKAIAISRIKTVKLTLQIVCRQRINTQVPEYLYANAMKAI